MIACEMHWLTPYAARRVTTSRHEPHSHDHHRPEEDHCTALQVETRFHMAGVEGFYAWPAGEEHQSIPGKSRLHASARPVLILTVASRHHCCTLLHHVSPSGWEHSDEGTGAEPTGPSVEGPECCSRYCLSRTASMANSQPTWRPAGPCTH